MSFVSSSVCCTADLAVFVAGPQLVVRRCRACGSLWGEHLQRHAGMAPWEDLEITDRFASALRARRLRQAAEILHAFPELPQGSVLDYGAGQGAFASTLIRGGLDVMACDVDVHAPGQLVADSHLLKLDQPWGTPPGWWGTVRLLDVLEHHPDPSRFLVDMPADRLLIKVPLADGPLTRAARVAAWAGSRTSSTRCSWWATCLPITCSSPPEVLWRSPVGAGGRSCARSGSPTWGVSCRTASGWRACWHRGLDAAVRRDRPASRQPQRPVGGQTQRCSSSSGLAARRQHRCSDQALLPERSGGANRCLRRLNPTPWRRACPSDKGQFLPPLTGGSRTRTWHEGESSVCGATRRRCDGHLASRELFDRCRAARGSSIDQAPA